MLGRSSSLFKPLILWSLFSLMTGAAFALPSPKEKWIEVRTENFTLFSSANKRNTLRIANDLEKLRSTLGQVTVLRQVSPLPTHIYVFKNSRTFTPYKPLYKGQPKEVGGVYYGRNHANYILIDAAPGPLATHVIYHEYAHYVFDNNMKAAMPVWLSEGLAEFYSTFETSDDHAYIGKVLPWHLDWLKVNPLIPLEQLFAIDRSSPDYNEGRRRGVFYAQSWALVHYMLADDERRLNLVDFLNRITAGEATATAFQQAFRSDYKAVEKKLQLYIRQRQFTYRRVEIDGTIDSTASVHPMERPDLLYRLGDALANQGNREAGASEHFRAALEIDPTHARATAGLGYLAEQSDDWAEARKLYGKAAAKATDDYLVQYLYGHSLLPRNGGTDQRLARAPLERSVQLRPNFPQTWANLALAYFDGKNVPPGVLKVAETAHRLQPARTDFALNLLSFYATSGDRQAATELVEGYFQLRGDPTSLAKAKRILATIDLNHAIRLARVGKNQQALELLESYEAVVEPDHRPAEATAFAAQLREATQEDPFIANFEAAKASFYANDFQAAASQLEVLLQQAPDESWYQKVEDLLRLTRHELGKLEAGQ